MWWRQAADEGRSPPPPPLSPPFLRLGVSALLVGREKGDGRSGELAPYTPPAPVCQSVSVSLLPAHA